MELIKPQKGTNYNIEHDIQNLTTIEQGFEQIDNKITNDITSSIDELKDKVDNDITTAITELDNKVDTEIVTAIDNLETKVNTEISESITALDNKVTTSLQEQAESLKKEISDQIAKVVANSPEDFDTLKEISDWISGHSSDAVAMNSAISGNTSAINQEILDRQAADTALQTNINNKVDKVSGKGLSTNDFTNADKTKLDGIEAGANKTVIDSALSSTSTNPVQNKIVNAALNNKVDKVSGKVLSTNDFTTAEKNKLAGIATGANKTIVDSSLSSTSTNPVQNKVVYTALSGKANISDLDNKVDKVSGKGLSTNDYTTTEKNKLAGIAQGANKTIVDSSLSSTSTNPVQNKVVYTALGNKVDKDQSINIRGATYNTVKYDDANPHIEFSETGGGQPLRLTYTSYDEYQSPSSLTLVGQQGGEYFIAPCIKATTRMKIPTSAPSSPQAGDIWIG